MAGQDKKGSSNAPAVTKDELDLNLSPPHFLTPVSNSETREAFAFDAQEDDDSMSISSDQLKILVIWMIASINHTRPKPFPLLILSEAINPNDRRQRTCAQQCLFVLTHH